MVCSSNQVVKIPWFGADMGAAMEWSDLPRRSTTGGSKYKPIERVFGVLENCWNGVPLTSVEKAMVRGMSPKEIHPTAGLIAQAYPKGVKLDKKAMKPYEKCLDRPIDLGKWFISISPIIAAATLDSMTI